jgi:hypothetical protein
MAKGKMGNHHGESVPDEKMGRYGSYSSSEKRAAKRRAAKKRRQRDRSCQRDT